MILIVFNEVRNPKRSSNFRGFTVFGGKAGQGLIEDADGWRKT